MSLLRVPIKSEPMFPFPLLPFVLRLVLTTSTCLFVLSFSSSSSCLTFSPNSISASLELSWNDDRRETQAPVDGHPHTHRPSVCPVSRLEASDDPLSLSPSPHKPDPIEEQIKERKERWTSFSSSLSLFRSPLPSFSDVRLTMNEGSLFWFSRTSSLRLLITVL